MTNPRRETDNSFSSARDLLMSGERTKRQEEIPVDLIVTENSLIDLQHVESLADSMMGDRKQISPVTLAARLESGQLVYHIIDGFHRTEGKKMIQRKTNERQSVLAVVLYGCKDEELFDLRVLAANSVKSIKFARMAEWMKQSFLATRWENRRIGSLIVAKMITLSQVFILAQTDSHGSRLHLEPGEVEELKIWALKKSKQWGKPVGALVSDMRIVEVAAPDLVQMVRSGGGGKDGKGVLTRARLETIVKNLPGDWEVQRQFAELALERNILAEDLDFLSFSYREAREAADAETMTKILSEPEKLLNPVARAGIEEGAGSSKLPDQNPVHLIAKGERPKRKHIRRNRDTDERHVSEQETLKRYRLVEIANSLINSLLAKEGDNLDLLHLPLLGTVKLDSRKKTLSLSEVEVELETTETRIMATLYVLEGIRVPLRLLSALNGDIGVKGVQGVVESLKEKLNRLSEVASYELTVNPDGSCVWLQE
jgi:hypothetical protein